MTRLLGNLLDGPRPLLAPLVLDPMMACLARDAGFRALYLGGGAMGYRLAVTEANLSLTEMAHAGADIRARVDLPLILDGACGWGDPMHQHRTIGLAEASGFAAIEIEDQILPKRAHHHVGVEHVIPADLMAAKIREAVAARRDPGFLVIGRTNALLWHGRDDALRRAEMMRAAGADILFVRARTAEDLRCLGERLPPPLMWMAAGDPAHPPIPHAELHALGYRLLVDPATPMLAAHSAMRAAYAALAAGLPDPTLGDTRAAEQHDIHATIGLDAMLAIEKRTVEPSPPEPHP